MLHNELCSWQKIRGNYYILNERNKMSVILNGATNFFWDFLIDGMSEADILCNCEKKFNVDTIILKEDFSLFLKELEKIGIYEY